MNMQPTPIVGVFVATTTFQQDARGSFGRLFCEQALASLLGTRHIAQINHSRTAAAGTIRGLHFQHPPAAEMKLVRCLAGTVFDVAVDLRRDSPTFRQWHAEELTPENGRILIIPEGCAHGFQALAPNSELLYLHTACYAPQLEGGLHYNDPRLGIRWPLPVADLSPRDIALPLMDDSFTGLAT